MPAAAAHSGHALKNQADAQAVMAAYHQASALLDQGDLPGAVAAYGQALATKPDFPEAQYNLGNALQAQGDVPGAVAAHRQALATKPDFPEAQRNLGIALQAQGDLSGAVAAYRQALVSKPDFPEAQHNLGNALQVQGDLQGAVAAYGQALAGKPDDPAVLSNLGTALQSQGNLQESMAAFHQALASKPDFSEARFHLSLLQLLLGDHERGWQGYESRFLVDKLKNTNKKPLPLETRLERWNGDNLAPGEDLILVSEQGLGDTLQFMRYAIHLKNSGILTSLCVPDKLRGLVEASGITETIYSRHEELEQCTTGKWYPLLSLPGYLQVRPDHPIIDTPYIQAPEQRIRDWQQKLAGEPGPVVGINWQGNLKIEKIALRGRSLPLESFAPIAEKTTVSLLSLQKGDGTEELADCPFRHRFVGCQEEINQTWDFVETAAIIANCDLVITSDTVVAHLSAGMGRPTWLLLTKVPDWRWGMTGDTSFWYPSMRLFRQRERGNWAEVMDRVTTALAAFVKTATAGNANDPKAHANLGNALKDQGDLQGAIHAYRQALAINPNDSEVYNSLGIALKRQGDLQGAIDAYGQALAMNPSYPEAYSNLGNALADQDNLQAAIDAYGQALAINPNYAKAHYNLGVALHKQGDLPAATHAYHQALAINPNHAGTQVNLSLLQLLFGDYERGWKGYEWRLRKKSPLLPHAHPQVERWNGSNLAPGERLIIVSEQGLGDTLQFMRYVLYLNNTGQSASLCAEARLHGLIRNSGITTDIYSAEQGNQLTTGKWFPLISLPGYLQVRPGHPVVDTPYIKAPEQQVGHWQQKLAREQRPVVGINWQGNPKTETISLRGRSLPLESFAPIAEKTTVSLLSLQKGDGAEQLADCSFRHRFVGCQEEINQTWDFVETAAIIANCDLIITSDTVVAHLSAGMGHPTWLLLTTVPDWRWGTTGDTSFWYPSMRLFRQREQGNWAEVMDRVATALETFVSHSIKKVIVNNPTDSEDHVNLGNALQDQGDLQGAIHAYRRALAINPQDSATCNKLGIALKGQGNLQAAIDAYRQALAIKPDFPQACYNLGIALQDQGDLQGAVDAYRQAIAIKPHYPKAYNNLGNTLQDQDNLQAAIDAYRQALAIKPDYSEAYNNLGTALKGQGDLQAAIDTYRQALDVNPSFPYAHWNLSLIQLLLGDYERGWQGYEWRFRTTPPIGPHAHPQMEQWNGHNLAPGEKLIIVSEQGLGDTLQFMRYVLYLNKTGLPTFLCGQTKLHGLIQTSEITTKVYSPEQGNQLTTGKWFPLLSLPGYLQVRPDYPIIDTPYIKAPQQKVRHWQQKLATEQRPIIGINWQGSMKIARSKKAENRRSLPLKLFAPIVEKTTVSLLALQKGGGAEQLADCSFRHRFVGCQEDINQTWDFVETAAMIANCDLDHHLRHCCCPLGSRDGATHLALAHHSPGLALGHDRGHQLLVPLHAPVPPAGTGQLGRGDGSCGHGAAEDSSSLTITWSAK